jgi:hypothetical protein
MLERRRWKWLTQAVSTGRRLWYDTQSSHGILNPVDRTNSGRLVEPATLLGGMRRGMVFHTPHDSNVEHRR